MSTVDFHLEELHKLVYGLDPAGSKGFEGLIASALADITELTFRLAKSGSQFGKDASTPAGTFAIAMEAKGLLTNNMINFDLIECNSSSRHGSCRAQF